MIDLNHLKRPRGFVSSGTGVVALIAATSRRLRAPEPGAPFTYVTTKRFLQVFGLASLCHLSDIERLEDEGLLQRLQSDIDLDGALGILREDDQLFADAMEFDEADEG